MHYPYRCNLQLFYASFELLWNLRPQDTKWLKCAKQSSEFKHKFLVVKYYFVKPCFYAGQLSSTKQNEIWDTVEVTSPWLGKI